MNRSLTAHGDEIQARLAAAPRVLLLSDFDGTLTPIVDNPDDAFLPADIHWLLTQILTRPDVRVAILSGRSLADLRPRVGLQGLIYAGNHGLEIEGEGMAFLEPTAYRLQEKLGALARTLAERLNVFAGVRVEDKGLTLSVHVRQVSADARPNVFLQLRQILHEAADDFVMTLGKQVFEVRPKISWSKGHAARWLLEQLGEPAPLSIAVGDDFGDEETFRALPGAITIRVGEHCRTEARFRAASPNDVAQLLQWLVDMPRLPAPVLRPHVAPVENTSG